MNNHKTTIMLGRAHSAGVAWARDLKVGDKFIGVTPIAAARYTDKTEIEMFENGAMTILMTYNAMSFGLDKIITLLD